VALRRVALATERDVLGAACAARADAATTRRASLIIERKVTTASARRIATALTANILRDALSGRTVAAPSSSAAEAPPPASQVPEATTYPSGFLANWQRRALAAIGF
jgi:hypothetical protein